MTSITYTSLVDTLQKCGLTEVTSTHIEYEGDKGGTFIVLKWDTNVFINGVRRNFEIAIEETVTRIIAELGARLYITRHHMTVTHGWDANRVYVDLGLIAFPERY
jgi:hypothetical protein